MFGFGSGAENIFSVIHESGKVEHSLSQAEFAGLVERYPVGTLIDYHDGIDGPLKEAGLKILSEPMHEGHHWEIEIEKFGWVSAGFICLNKKEERSEN